jgi:hypothetical protein
MRVVHSLVTGRPANTGRHAPRMRFRGTHTISLPLPPDRALPLFTARGERAWVPGWQPHFPDGEPEHTEDEGTVFVTAHGEVATYWVVAARQEHAVRYARTTPGRSSGTVDVHIREAPNGHSDVEVTYDLTALTPEGEHAIEHLAANFEAEIGGWEQAIAAATG